MIKNFIKLISLSSIVLLSVGCNKSDSNSKSTVYDSTKTYESVKLNNQNISLRYNFEKGDKHKYKLTTITTAEESIQADSLIKSKTSQKLLYIFDIEVLDVEEDKTAELNINISSLKLDADINGQKFNFDSKADLSNDDKSKFLEYASISNSPYRARVSQKGEVIEVTRLDKMIDKMNSLQPQQQKLSVQEKAQLSKNLGDAAVRPLTQLLFRELPEKQIAKDSTWERRYPSQMTVFNVENIARFKVEDFIEINNERTAKISTALSVNWSGEKKGEEEGIKYSFDDPKMSGTGSILFNIDKGILLRAETATKVELKVEIQAKDSTQKLKKTNRREFSTNKNIVELL